MNLPAVKAIYKFEMARAGRTLLQSMVSPVISTSLYFVVFGAAIGSRISEIEGVHYGAFIVPGLIMLMRAHQSVANARSASYSRAYRHDLRAALGADLLSGDRDRLCRRRSHEVDHSRPGHPRHGVLFVPLHIAHPFWMVAFPSIDGGDIQPARLHHRHLGRRLREAADSCRS
jgi:ABC-2 type transport system permease protein